jgi:hypothetical protein
MIEHETVERQWLMGQPTPIHTLKEQVTLIKGWTQLVSRYTREELPGREDGIRKGLTRIDAAATQLIELLIEVLPPTAQV